MLLPGGGVNNGAMVARRTETFRTLASPSRVELLHLLQERGGRTLTELVEATGLHANTVREHLHRLMHGGYVTSTTEVRTTRGRPRTLYSAATGTADGATEDMARKVAAAAERGDALRRYLATSGEGAGEGSEVAPEAAGTLPPPVGCVPWPRHRPEVLDEAALHQIDALDDHLDQSGFNACIDESRLHVDITDCPYQEMVEASQGTVCVVHLGLVRTVLSQAGGPIEARELLPFSGPGHCTLALGLARTDPAAQP